jgi:hypothetical protein
MTDWPVPRKAKKFYAFPYLYEKYGQWLRAEIIEINLLHNSNAIILEIISNLPQPSDPDESQKLVQEINLSFIFGFEVPADSIFDDAKRLIEDFDPYSIINTLPIFTKEASEFISHFFHAKDS